MAKKIVTLLFWTVLLAWIISLFVCLTSLSAIRNNKEMNSIYVFWVVIPSMATYRYLTIINTTAQIVTDHEAHMTSIVLHLCLIVEARRASFWYARSAPRGGEIGNTQSRWLCGDNA